MRIAYVAKGHFASGAGVLRKIDGQTEAWRAAGNATRLFALTSARCDNLTPACPTDMVFAGGGISRVSACRELVRRIVSWQPDIVYLRQSTYQPWFSVLFSLAPVVIEINADDTKELWLVSRKSHLYNLATRSRILRRASGFVFVTNELAYSPSFARFAKTRAVVANGINLAEIHLRAQAPNNDQPRLFFIGSSGFRWHGIDKILLLAQKRPQWRFDIVGGIGAVTASLPPNVVSHEHLQQSDYAELLASADVAISTLALHRKMMEEASPLKTREYLAAGVPTILAYRDTDFLRGAPFLLQLPNVEENILPQIGRIDEFVQRMRGVTVPRTSVAHLDWSEKEPVRLAFFRHVVNAARLSGASS